MKFLLGLNEDFSTVRSQILAGKELPSMDAAFSTVLTDEKQRGVTIKKYNLAPDQSHIDTAMAVKKGSGLRSEPYNSDKYKYSKKGVKLNFKMRCDHCWYFGHTKDSCYHLIGYPKDDSGKHSASSVAAKKVKTDQANSATSHTITDEEYKIMQNFFMKNAGPLY